MSMMELLTIPGLDSSADLNRMYKESKRRMNKAVERQAMGIAMMNLRNREKRKSKNASR